MMRRKSLKGTRLKSQWEMLLQRMSGRAVLALVEL
jgi:hypothetical protein